MFIFHVLRNMIHIVYDIRLPPTDTLAGEIVSTLEQLATAGHGYAGPDGTKCITTRTGDRSNPLLYGVCPSDIKPVCKRRSKSLTILYNSLFLCNQLRVSATWVCFSKISMWKRKQEMTKPWKLNSNC